MITQKIEEIKTKRLTLRPFRIEDALQMYENWASDSRVTKYMTWKAHTSIEQTKDVISRWIDKYDETINYVMECNKTSTLIGGITTFFKDKNKELIEIGYCIGYDYWNQGYTTEALKKLIEYYFEVGKAKKIYATFDENNVASGKVMAKAGLLFESRSIRGGVNNLGLCNKITYSLLDNQYFLNRQINEFIRIATFEQVELVTQLLNKLYKTDYFELLKENKNLMTTNNNIFFLYQDKAVAHLSIKTDYVNGKKFDKPCGFLEGIYVESEYRNQHIATSLLEAIEKYLISNGYLELLSDCLIDNINSYNFHIKSNFNEIEKTICFQKTLQKEK